MVVAPASTAGPIGVFSTTPPSMKTSSKSFTGGNRAGMAAEARMAAQVSSFVILGKSNSWAIPVCHPVAVTLRIFPDPRIALGLMVSSTRCWNGSTFRNALMLSRSFIRSSSRSRVKRFSTRGGAAEQCGVHDQALQLLDRAAGRAQVGVVEGIPADPVNAVAAAVAIIGD